MKAAQRKAALWLMLVLALSFTGSVEAAKFSRAKVTKVVNDVKLLSDSQKTRAASRGSVVSGSTAVLTGQKSRAELQFPDESLVRLGSNSVFSFSEGKRDMEMKKGTMLMQVPKSMGRTQVKTAAVTAAITGTTILLEYVPDEFDANGKLIRRGSIKIIVVEGSLEFYLNASPRRKMTLKPGEMVAFPSNAQLLPKKLNFDIPRLMKTSGLLNMGQLPELKNIRREVASQGRLKKSGKLVEFKVTKNSRPRNVTGTPSNNNIRRARVTVNSRPAPPAPPAVVRQPRQNTGNNSSPPPRPTPVVLPDRPDRELPNTGGSTGGTTAGT